MSSTFLSFLLFFPLVSSVRLGISNGTNVADSKCQSGYHIAGTYDPVRQGPYCTPVIVDARRTTIDLIESTRCDTCKFVIQAATELIEPECKIAAEILTPNMCNFLCKDLLV